MLETLETKGSIGGNDRVELSLGSSTARQLHTLHRKINFVFAGERRAPNPVGWEEYDGSIYNVERGYGWLTDLSKIGQDRGVDTTIILAEGKETSAYGLGRPELANWQGRHQENLPLVFRLDVPNGWYRVMCTSVDPGTILPLVDQRSFKCRAHDVVFAGASYGAPLVVSGQQLIEGTGVVEITDDHLRLVVGDPAYAGWTWRHQAPWYKGWRYWLAHDSRYAANWYQKLTRRVDPGFHSLRLNSLEVEQVIPPSPHSSLVFRDFFNRDDSPEVNAGLGPAQQWRPVKLHPDFPTRIRADLYKTSIRLTGPPKGTGIIGLLQQIPNPATGVVRYETRVSLFLGAGSQQHRGMQEAGVLLLVEPTAPNEYAATFVGVAFNTSRPGTPGRLLYRVGDGAGGYRTILEIPDTALPFQIREGEYEILVEHDVAQQVLRRIKVNGVDVTDRVPLLARQQRLVQGLFGIRGMIAAAPGGRLEQFYWFYRVEQS